MKTWIMSLCRNEADVLPFYLRHYGQFASKIIIWDDWSNDGTREMLQKEPNVELHNWPYDDGIDETMFLKFAKDTYPMARGQADWVIWVDIDEFIWAPDVIKVLDDCKSRGVDVIQTEGWNMVGDGMPKYDGRQIWEALPDGVRAPVYSKPVVFNPNVDMKWNRGKHALEPGNYRLSDGPLLKLLHYRYLGREYTAMKNARNYARCGLKTGDKGPAWTCAPGYNGEHSAEWAAQIKGKAVNALKA